MRKLVYQNISEAEKYKTRTPLVRFS